MPKADSIGLWSSKIFYDMLDHYSVHYFGVGTVLRAFDNSG
jgi:hypothetical protein